MVLLVGGLKDHDAVLGLEELCGGVESLLGLAGLLADAGHDAEALGLDVDLAVLALVGADLLGVRVVGAEEPFSVPAVREDGLLHEGDFL